MAIQRDLPGAREAIEEYAEREVSTTPINAFEMCLGAYASSRPDNLLKTVEMLTNIPLLPLDLEACIEAGRIGGSLRKSGEGIDARDALIAGIVKRHEETLITRNAGHFDRVDGLKIRKW